MKYAVLRSLFHFPIDALNLFTLKRKKVQYGKNLRIRGFLHVHGSGKISLGDNVNIISTPSVNPIGGNARTFLQAEKGAEIIIGNNVGMTASAVTAFTKVEIDDDVLLGRSVCVYDTDFHSIHYDERIKGGKEGAVSQPVHIKEGAFIGAHAIILKGVTIGKHSIVGAGSVVTKNIPDGEIWAGNPAKMIKRAED